MQDQQQDGPDKTTLCSSNPTRSSYRWRSQCHTGRVPSCFVDWEGCGAALILPQVIISTAHSDEAIDNNAIGHMVYIGSYIEGTEQNGAVMWTLTQHVSPHPLYHTNTLSHPYGCCETQSTHHYCPRSSTQLWPDCSCLATESCCHEPLVLYTPPPEQLPTHCKKVTVDYVPNNVCTGPNFYNGDVDGNIMTCALPT